MPGPLAGITVVDLTRVLSGPYCTMLLADMGARVIKIERPGRGDDTRDWGPPFVGTESAYFLSVNRNKESLTLNFKHPDGRRVLEALLDRADALVENFRPGTLDRIGLGYSALGERFPRLVYCSISGYGHTGPKRDLPGYDAVLQAEGGLMSINGAENGPPYRIGIAIADIVSGIFAAQGVLLALLQRERTGQGQHVDVGMLDSVAALLTYQAGIHFATGNPPARLGNRHPTIVPYEMFDAADSQIVVAVGTDLQWQKFCHALGVPSLACDARFATNGDRVSRYDELRPMLARVLVARPAQSWIERLTAVGIPCGRVRGIDDVVTDPQLIARAMVTAVEHPAVGMVRQIGIPIKLNATPGEIRVPPPVLGQHTDIILRQELALDEAQIARLRCERVI